MKKNWIMRRLKMQCSRTVEDIINFLQPDVEWVDYGNTRDQLLLGNRNFSANKIMVCWVATTKLIELAVREKYDMIVTHENFLYTESTKYQEVICRNREYKKKLLQESNISVYRCHDLWDLFPKIGVKDKWIETITANKQVIKRKDMDFYSFIEFERAIEFKALAQNIAQEIKDESQNGIQIIGDFRTKIKKVGIGTGAITNVAEMLRYSDVDCLVVTDDGINNWVDVQLAMDSEINLIIVNHYTSEARGIACLAEYLQHGLKDIWVRYFPLNYQISYVEE